LVTKVVVLAAIGVAVMVVPIGAANSNSSMSTLLQDLGLETAATAPAATTPTAIPLTPTSVTAVASTTSTSVAVSWVFATTGATPDRAEVTAYQGTTDVGAIVCTLPICSSTVIPGLVAGEAYTFKVQAGVAAGYSAALTSAAVLVGSGCTGANVCATVNADAPGAPTDHVAAGLLSGVADTTPAALVAPLDIQQWRLDDGPPNCTSGSCVGYGEYIEAKALAPNASVTEVLSDNWYAYTYNAYEECGNVLQCALSDSYTPYGGAATPWSNWTTFDNFTQSVVADVMAAGETVNYWDLINEPPAQTNQNDTYFPYNTSKSLTAADLEEWFLHAYDDVKAVDPAAQIVCPSFESYADYPGELPPNGQLLDFSTFLAFAAANGIDCNAFSWHEINSVGDPTDFNMEPQDITAHVARFRSLLSNYPQYANAQIFINEYGAFAELGGGSTQLYEEMPGWTVGYIAALEAAGVNQANRSCTAAGCSNLLDNLFVTSGSSVAPSDVYWPYWFYAQMNGNQIPVTSSAEQVSGFADLNAAGNMVQMLIGRHEVGVTGSSALETLNITVDVPWADGTVVNLTSQSYAYGGGAVAEPPITASGGQVVNGTVTISVPSIAGENAYGITLAPVA
jgi:hypothetical protein